MAKSSTPCIPVILSGGMGTRLWPLSRGNFPKQFLRLAHPSFSLFQQTLQRVGDRTQFAAPLIICNEEHRFLVAEQLREIGVEDATILLEPNSKNTAPALACAAYFLQEQHREATLLILPSDHIIADDAAFLAAVKSARSLNHLTTFGITPTHAETGYGYIQKGTALTSGFAVQQFVEKPDAATAAAYLASGDYCWNSGMFCFALSLCLEELEKHQPALSAIAKKAAEQRRESEDFIRLPADIFTKLPSISIDYALMEKTSHAAVIPLDCGWTDAGSFDALWQIAAKDSAQNVIHGNTHLHDSNACFVHAAEGMMIATLGVENLIIIATPDAVMVADKSRAQEVKRLVDALKPEHHSQVECHTKVARPWGSYERIDCGKGYLVKRIVVKPEGKLSLQIHQHRAEHWVVVSGKARVTKGEEQHILTANQSIYIPQNTPHRLENASAEPLEIIEVQSGELLSEDDIIRLEDTYGRATNSNG